MTIRGVYSFAKGEEFIQKHHAEVYKDVETVIQQVDASACLTKESKEKTMRGRMLYSPVKLNEQFKKYFHPRGWTHVKEYCEYSTKYYVGGYKPEERKVYPFRDMDFVKEKLGVEIQFGKYPFMVYNVCAKMTIFKSLSR